MQISSIDFKEIAAVVFDMDGTLVDNIPFHQRSWLELLARHQIQVDEETFAAQNHGTGPEMIRRFFGPDHSEEKVFDLWQMKESIYRSLYLSQIRPVPGLHHLLDKLRASEIKIALATMGTSENIDLVLDNLLIRDYFSCIVKGDEVLKGKPDPEVYLKVAAKLKIEPFRLLAVEDSFGGIASAMTAGLSVVGVTTSHTSAELLKNGAIAVISDYHDLINLMGFAH